MSAFEWAAIGLICAIGGLGFALTLLSINGRTEGDDAEERRTVGKAAQGDEWSQEQMRERGWM